MKKYCDNCENEVETKVITKKEVYTVLGEDIEVEAQVLVCSNCNEELFCEELDGATLINAYNEYRRRHKLLLPTEIKQIRELYGLSQRSFAKLLNWGDKTIHRYENGYIQDKAHNSLLLFLRNPKNMKTYLEENENSLETKQVAKLSGTVERLIDTDEAKNLNDFFTLYVSGEPSIENGFKKHQVISDTDTLEIHLTEKETEVLERIYNKFKNFGSAEISNYSHKEKGYCSTSQGEIISYIYASDMTL